MTMPSAALASTPSAAKSTGNDCAMSWRDSTIIAPVSACHRVSYTERYSRFMDDDRNLLRIHAPKKPFIDLL